MRAPKGALLALCKMHAAASLTFELRDGLWVTAIIEFIAEAQEDRIDFGRREEGWGVGGGLQLTQAF